MRIIKSIEDAKTMEGEEIGLSDWVVVDQHRIDQFAEATADHQWIHVDTERAAKEMPDGKTIAHGLWCEQGAFLHTRAGRLQGSRSSGYVAGAQACRSTVADV